MSFVFVYFEKNNSSFLKFLVALHGLTRIRRILLSSQFVKVTIYFKIYINLSRQHQLYLILGTGQNPEDQWGEPKYFPPGDPEVPASPPLNKPTTPMEQCSCSALKLPYNPNTELDGKVAMFYCFTLNGGVETPKNINWDLTAPGGPGVEIATTDRCHLFCDKVNNCLYLYYCLHLN